MLAPCCSRTRPRCRTWQVGLYAALALTVARMLPVAMSLIRTSVIWRDRLFLGWARPRGIGAVVFGLLAYVELTGPDAEFVLAVMVVIDPPICSCVSCPAPSGQPRRQRPGR